MAYKKDQGRYARMAAFWAIVLLLAYGCLGGFVILLRNLFGRLGGVELTTAWVDPFPLIGVLDLASAIGIALLLVLALIVRRILERPRIADVLIDTESELKKVTWPAWNETLNGSVAVIVTVVVLFAYLTAADFLLAEVMTRAMGATS
jgi:preprotein translocase SecE subunit